ncbi:hypothetical protein PHLCEN_2v3225 [Hermanssonia centrifuga]|uniref:Uncharacterized protein n=1 Tax=Hermanssonia centrifuga TaxID=98765 RepID=A0A2R6QXK9_9APHY|nr:hypothetical protein PHLCEN_2v3225 [Hermanssonia centrifuga]
MAIFIKDYSDSADKWTKTCEHLPPLQKLVLGFSSREDMTRFVREVVCTKLDDLRSTDRVTYAVLQGGYSYGMWFRVSVDSEELKGKCRSLSMTQSLTRIHALQKLALKGTIYGESEFSSIPPSPSLPRIYIDHSSIPLPNNIDRSFYKRAHRIRRDGIYAFQLAGIAFWKSTIGRINKRRSSASRTQRPRFPHFSLPLFSGPLSVLHFIFCLSSFSLWG